MPTDETLAYKHGSDYPRWVPGGPRPPINYDYRPRLDQVGQPAGKVFVADGTRYLECEGGTESLDFDAYPYVDPRYPSQGLFGSFTDPAPWWCGSTAYGVEQGSLNWDGMPVDAGEYPKARGKNLALSYRHGADIGAATSAQSNPGRMNALFFDGRRTAKRSPFTMSGCGTRAAPDPSPEGMTACRRTMSCLVRASDRQFPRGRL